MRDYLNFGIHKGLEACIRCNDGKWNPGIFKRWSANLSGDVVTNRSGQAIIVGYPTNKATIQSLEMEMYDLCDTLGIEFVHYKKQCIIQRKKNK